MIDFRPVWRSFPKWVRNYIPFKWYSEEFWNLNNELAEWIYPHLVKMRQQGIGYPGIFNPEEADITEEEAVNKWNSILDEMIIGFGLLRGSTYFYNSTEADKNKIQRAFDLLAEYWPYLWD